ncbi:hypothetical protein TNCV_1955761 [Trichonephila clavipes]|nr:hypothetical protein TNCV_1955761 [Trichonephila clavipes]
MPLCKSILSKGAWLKDSCHRFPLCVIPETLTHCPLLLECYWAGTNLAAIKWSQVAFNDESRFNLSSDDGRVHEWRLCGARLNPAFAVYSPHTWCDGMKYHSISHMVTPNFGGRGSRVV